MYPFHLLSICFFCCFCCRCCCTRSTSFHQVPVIYGKLFFFYFLFGFIYKMNTKINCIYPHFVNFNFWPSWCKQREKNSNKPVSRSTAFFFVQQICAKKSNLTQKISNKTDHVMQNAQSELSLYTTEIFVCS